MMQQRSAVDLRRLTNVKMSFSQSVWAVLRQSVYYCQVLNQVLKVFSRTIHNSWLSRCCQNP